MTNPRDILLTLLPARLHCVDAFVKLNLVLDKYPGLFSPEEEAFLTNNLTGVITALQERYRDLESELEDDSDYDDDDQ